MERAVISGMGVVSALGNDLRTFADRLYAGESGTDYIKKPTLSGFTAAEVKEEKHWECRELALEEQPLSRADSFAIRALEQALKQAGLKKEMLKESRTALILGGSNGGWAPERLYCDLHRKELKDRKEYEQHTAALLAALLDIRGHVEVIYNACASGAVAIGKATELIRGGEADFVITGGSDSGINMNELSLFSALNAMSRDKDAKKACRPFSKNRSGCVIGEGAGILILESLKNARKRGTAVHGEILGWGAVTDISHVTSPDLTGQDYRKTMEAALADAGRDPEEVGYINAHGTGTYYNDMLETGAIRQLFKSRADQIPVSSSKAVTGHLLSAAGALECIVSALALEKGLLPPTAHLNQPDEDCDLDYITEGSRKKAVSLALSNSFGFGGQNASLVLRKVEDYDE